MALQFLLSKNGKKYIYYNLHTYHPKRSVPKLYVCSSQNCNAAILTNGSEEMPILVRDNIRPHHNSCKTVIYNNALVIHTLALVKKRIQETPLAKARTIFNEEFNRLEITHK